MVRCRQFSGNRSEFDIRRRLRHGLFDARPQSPDQRQRPGHRLGRRRSGPRQHSALRSLCGTLPELGARCAALSRARQASRAAGGSHAPWRERRRRNQARCRMSLERARARLSDIVRLMAPRPGRLELATRLAVICALTVLVVEIYQTPDAALTVYVAFFFNRGDRAVSVILSVVLVALITVIVGFIVLVAMIVINDPMWRVISMTAISIAILFIASASKLRPLGGTIALIVAYALDLLGTIPLAIGEVATRSLLYAWLFVAIPAGISMIVNLLVAPPPRRLAEQRIAHGLDLSAAMLKAPNENIRSEFREHLREGMAEIQKLLGLADREKTSKSDDIAALRQAAGSTTLLMSAVDVMDRRPEARLALPIANYLARTLREMSGILRAGGYP